MNDVKKEFNSQTIREIAHLARIGISDEESQQLAGELIGILEWISMMDDIDTNEIEPMLSVSELTLRQRKDQDVEQPNVTDVLANAPDKIEVDEGGFFCVPKMIET